MGLGWVFSVPSKCGIHFFSRREKVVVPIDALFCFAAKGRVFFGLRPIKGGFFEQSKEFHFRTQKKQSGSRKKNAGERFLQLLISDVFFVEPSDVGGFFPPKSQRWDNLLSIFRAGWTSNSKVQCSGCASRFLGPFPLFLPRLYQVADPKAHTFLQPCGLAKKKNPPQRLRRMAKLKPTWYNLYPPMSCL